MTFTEYKHNLANTKIMVTGGESMIGRAIVCGLKRHGACIDEVPHKYCDLLEYQQIYNRIKNFQPDYVIHAAGWNGGIRWNNDYPATIFYRTATMALNVLKAASELHVSKIVSILASCSYPDSKSNEPLNEESLWHGKPNDTVECHGLAKRILDVYSRQIYKEFGTMAVTCILTNCYGEFDSYNPDKTKVVGAMIRKLVEAKQNQSPSVTFWGSGKPLRELMYAEDAGEAIVQVLEKYEDPFLPINIASDIEISIKELAELIAEIVGYTGEIIWDTTKPDGQMRKKLDTTQMQELLSVQITPIEDGLKNTIKWYINNKAYADAKSF